MTYCPRCTDGYGVHNVRLWWNPDEKVMFCYPCSFRDGPVSDAKLQYHLQSNKVPL